MTVRAKFRCEKKEASPDGSGFALGFSVVTNEPKTNPDGTPFWDTPDENKEFFRWTPWGQLSMGTVNPAAAAQFEVGADYYVDFIKAEK